MLFCDTLTAFNKHPTCEICLNVLDIVKRHLLTLFGISRKNFGYCIWGSLQANRSWEHKQKNMRHDDKMEPNLIFLPLFIPALKNLCVSFPWEQKSTKETYWNLQQVGDSHFCLKPPTDELMRSLFIGEKKKWLHNNSLRWEEWRIPKTLSSCVLRQRQWLRQFPPLREF